MGIGEEQRVAAQENEARNKIAAADMAKVKEQQARIYELLGEEEKRAELARQANMQSIQAMGGVAGQIQEGYGQKGKNDVFGETENSMLQSLNSGTLTPEQQYATQQDLNFLRLQKYGGY